MYNDIQLIKREFFSMRNGVIADTLRKAGASYRIIFGLTLPQLSDIAKTIGENKTLAERLWENNTTRESMLLAPMIFPRSEMSVELALKWVNECKSTEVIDVLCHRLLRHLEYAPEIASELSISNDPLSRYAALRLYLNTLSETKKCASEFAQKELMADEPFVRLLARQIIDEIDFINEN